MSRLGTTAPLLRAAVEELHLLDRDYFRFLRRLLEASPRVYAARKLRRTEPSPAKSSASVAAAPAAPPAAGTSPVVGPLAEGTPIEGPGSPAVCAGGADAGAAAGAGSGRAGAGSGAAAGAGAASMSGMSGGGHALGGGGEGPTSGAGGGRGGAYTRTDDAERFTLGTLSLALQFLFRVCGKIFLLLQTDLRAYA